MGYHGGNPEERYQKYIADKGRTTEPPAKEPQTAPTAPEAAAGEETPSTEPTPAEVPETAPVTAPKPTPDKTPAPPLTGSIARKVNELNRLRAAYPADFTKIGEMRELPDADKLIGHMIRSNSGIVEAYQTLHSADTAKKATEAAREKEAGKSHLTSVGNVKQHAPSPVSIDTSQMRELKRNFPDKTEKEIRELYRKVMKHST